MRESGILLHPTSLPGPEGIGTLGEGARWFVDFLEAAGQRLWQTLPLGPTGYGDSPYQCTSAFAGNPMLIDLEALVDEGLLEAGARRVFTAPPRGEVDHEGVGRTKRGLLREAWRRFAAEAGAPARGRFEAFCAAEAAWLDDHALFAALAEAHGESLWLEWPAALRQAEPRALAEARGALAEVIEAVRFEQYLFRRQWQSVRAYARAKGVTIIGDLPIFVALHSSDVWGRRELFELDASGAPTVVAGVPPDYFSATGQLWGNPLYRWEALADEGYAWWLSRFRAALAMSDLVRVDHFRGFEAYWEVPADAPNAIGGRWRPGPGAAFFEAVEAAFGRVPIIAEDLGTITPPVEALRDAFGLPGMKVLHFAFGGEADNPYLPHNYTSPRCVVYPGTHDNDTSVGWYCSAPAAVAHHARIYLGRDGSDIAWELLRAAWSSVAERAIVTAQDLLSLGSEARMNTPGVAAGNWSWRLRPGQLKESVAERLRAMSALYGRLPEPPEAGARASRA